MAKKEKILTVCYDAGTTITKSKILCPICGEEKEIQHKEVPELRTVIVECCGKQKYRNWKL